MKIHALSTGHVAIKTNQMRGRGDHRWTRLSNVFRDAHWSGSLPIHVWVIEHPEGIIVVDTGDTALAPPGWQHPFPRFANRKVVRPEEEIGPQLQRLGIQARDVRWVVLTHLHIDHDGGLSYFPNAEIVIAAGEYREASGLRGRVQGYVPQRWPGWLKPNLITLPDHPFGVFAKSLPLTKAADVIVVATPGHTNHHQSVIVQQDGLAYFLAGDTSYTQQGLLESWVDGVSPSKQTALDTLRRIREFAKHTPTVYLPAHDPEAKARLETRQTVFHGNH